MFYSTFKGDHMNKYIFALAALLVAPAVIAECGGGCGTSGEELVKKTIKRSLEVEKSCCSGCTSCGKCTCKSHDGEKEESEEATTKCNCGKPKPKAEEK